MKTPPTGKPTGHVAPGLAPVSGRTEKSIAITVPSLGEDECRAVREPLLSGWVTQGPQVARFEKEFARRHAVRNALATSSCTTALHLTLEALEIGEGDEVIVPGFTWVATANVVRYCRAIPVFVDVDRATYNIRPDLLEAAIGKKTKAIIAVHLFGLCADIDAIAKVAGGIPMIEDAACAVGAAYRGRWAGTLGRAGCFSFHPRKVITTGEGGIVTTDDDDLAECIRRLRNHGASVSEEERHGGPRPYILPEFNVLGFNYRMTDIQGAVGVVQLGKLDALLAERTRWAEFYSRELSSIPWLRTPQVPNGYVHGWQSYVCYIDEERAPMTRDIIMERLASCGISTRPGTHAVHMLGYYRERFGLCPDDLPAARDCDRYTMAIPLHGAMTEDDYQYVVDSLRNIEG